MTLQYTPNLGETPKDDARRDAVHVAVAPVIASVRLRPGCHVGLDESGQAEISEFARCIGVVDPFLKEYVEPGQRCWVFLYPNTVTSLRHVWQHPAFKVKVLPLPGTEDPRSNL